MCVDDPDRHIELHPRKGLVAVLLAASTAITIGGAVLTIQSVQAGAGDLFNALVAGLVALLFGLLVASSAAGLVSTRPALRVDDVGIYDYTSLMAPGLITWEEMAAISYLRFMVQGYMLIEP